MVTAHLKMAPGQNGTCWDKLTLIVKTEGKVVPIIKMDRNVAIESYRQIMVAHFEQHNADLEVSFGERVISLTPEEWSAVGHALEQWFEEYMLLEATI